MGDVLCLSSAPSLWPAENQQIQAKCFRLLVRRCFFSLFFKAKLWSSETVPELSALAQAPHTGSSIRILLLPRPCRDLAVNLQTPSPFIARVLPKQARPRISPSRLSAPRYSLAFIVTVMYVH